MHRRLSRQAGRRAERRHRRRAGNLRRQRAHAQRHRPLRRARLHRDRAGVLRSRRKRRRARLRRRRLRARHASSSAKSASIARSRTSPARPNRSASAGRIGCVGYCWGGTVAFLAATRLGDAGGQLLRRAQREVSRRDAARRRVQFHFGETRHVDSARGDRAAPRSLARRGNLHLSGRPRVRSRASIRSAYDAPSAKLALERTLAFFARHLAAA